MTMVYAILAITLVALIVIIPFVRNYLKKKRDYAVLKEQVHQTNDKYCFLVDRDFHVKETNFYQLNDRIPDDQPYVLGNVLHCQIGCDSGLCGTGIACPTCPVRMVLNNAFKLHRDFNNITAVMHLYNENYVAKDVNVKVDGEFVYVGHEPHFIVNVSK